MRSDGASVCSLYNYFLVDIAVFEEEEEDVKDWSVCTKCILSFSPETASEMKLSLERRCLPSPWGVEGLNLRR